MTRTPQSRWRTRACRALLAAGAVVFVLPGGADAARRTSSQAIAGEAGRAVEALEQWRESQTPADYVRYVQGRDAAAARTAAELELDAAALGAAWAAAPAEKQHAVLAAVSQLGVPYEHHASEPGVGFDCSGLTLWAFAEAGVELPRVSRDQIGASDDVELAAAEPGDLVYYPGHIGIYLGVETYIHSPNEGNDVEAVHLPEKTLRFGDAVVAEEL